MSATAFAPGPATVIEDDLFSPTLLASKLRTTRAELTETLGLAGDALSRKDRLAATKTQMRLRELVEILERTAPRHGGQLGAYAWFRSFPMPGYGHRTPAQLVRAGRAASVHRYLDRRFAGGYA